MDHAGSQFRRSIPSPAGHRATADDPPREVAGRPGSPSGPTEPELLGILSRHLSPLTASSALRSALTRSQVRLGSMRPGDERRLLQELERGVRLFISDPRTTDGCLAALRALLLGRSGDASPRGGHQVHHLPVVDESDIVKARGLGRELCVQAGCSTAGQVRFTTVVSELARNIVQYAGQGELTLQSRSVEGRVQVEVCAVDQGPGIPHLDEILAGRYQSRRGLGKGLTGSRQLMDEFDIQSRPGHGTQVVARMLVR